MAGGRKIDPPPSDDPPSADPSPTDEDVEISLEDSFPASDPPGFIRESRVGSPPGHETGERKDVGAGKRDPRKKKGS
jgi:hypothetical protein